MGNSIRDKLRGIANGTIPQSSSTEPIVPAGTMVPKNGVSANKNFGQTGTERQEQKTAASAVSGAEQKSPEFGLTASDRRAQREASAASGAYGQTGTERMGYRTAQTQKASDLSDDALEASIQRKQRFVDEMTARRKRDLNTGNSSGAEQDTMRINYNRQKLDELRQEKAARRLNGTYAAGSGETSYGAHRDSVSENKTGFYAGKYAGMTDGQMQAQAKLLRQKTKYELGEDRTADAQELSWLENSLQAKDTLKRQADYTGKYAGLTLSELDTKIAGLQNTVKYAMDDASARQSAAQELSWLQAYKNYQMYSLIGTYGSDGSWTPEATYDDVTAMIGVLQKQMTGADDETQKGITEKMRFLRQYRDALTGEGGLLDTQVTELEQIQKQIDTLNSALKQTKKSGKTAAAAGIQSALDSLNQKKSELKAQRDQTHKAAYGINGGWGQAAGNFAGLAGNAFMQGITAAANAGYKTLDTLTGHTALKGITEESNKELAKWQEKTEKSAEKLGAGNGWKKTGEYLASAAEALPGALLAMWTAGGSVAAQLSAQSTGIMDTIVTTARSMAKDPQYWLSFVQEFSGAYDDAKKAGASESAALASSTLVGLLNAVVEIGLDGGSGIQGLPEKLMDGNKNAVLEFVESNIGEGEEEIVQGAIGRLTGKLFYNNISWSGDDDSVANFKTSAQEFAGGFIVGAMLGGGQTVGVKAYVNIENARTDAQIGSEVRTKDADGTLFTQMILTGYQSGKGSESYKLALKYAGADTDSMSDAELGRFYRACLTDSLKSRETAEGAMEQIAESQLLAAGEDAATAIRLKALLARAAYGEDLTSEEQAAVSVNDNARTVLEGLRGYYEESLREAEKKESAPVETGAEEEDHTDTELPTDDAGLVTSTGLKAEEQTKAEPEKAKAEAQPETQSAGTEGLTPEQEIFAASGYPVKGNAQNAAESVQTAQETRAEETPAAPKKTSGWNKQAAALRQEVSLNGEKTVSPAELGVKNGSKDAINYVAPESTVQKYAAAKEAEQVLRDAGYTPVFVTGQIEADGALVRIAQADGGRVIVQADNRVSPADTARAFVQENGGYSNGTAEVSDAGGERNNGVGAGGQAGRLAEGAGSAEERAADAGAAAADGGDRAGDAETAAGAGRKSAAELGIEDGTDRKSLKVVAPEEDGTYADEKLQSVQDFLGALGIRATFVQGQIWVRNKYTGKAQAVTAAVTESGDVIVRADSPKVSAMALGRHEAFHVLVRANPGLRARIAETLYARYSEEEILNMARAYAEGYEGIYGSWEENQDAYIEELLADAYAGINRTFARTGKYADIVRAGVEENMSASELAAEKRAGGGAYSIETLPDGKKYVQADRQVLKSKDPNNWENEIEQYINEKIREGKDVLFPTMDGHVLVLTERSAYKLSDRHKAEIEGKAKELLSDEEFGLKGRIAGQIDELIQVGKFDNYKPDINGKHENDIGEDGFNYFSAFFRDVDGQYYRITFSSALNDDLETVYSIGKVRKRERSTGRGSSSTRGGAQNGGSLFNDIIYTSDGKSQENADTTRVNHFFRGIDTATL